MNPRTHMGFFSSLRFGRVVALPAFPGRDQRAAQWLTTSVSVAGGWLSSARATGQGRPPMAEDSIEVPDGAVGSIAIPADSTGGITSINPHNCATERVGLGDLIDDLVTARATQDAVSVRTARNRLNWAMSWCRTCMDREVAKTQKGEQETFCKHSRWSWDGGTPEDMNRRCCDCKEPLKPEHEMVIQHRPYKDCTDRKCRQCRDPQEGG